MQSTPTKIEDRAPVTIAPVITLALWRLRRTWFLLCIITAGLIAAVIVSCTIPLFATATTTSGLQSLLSASPSASQITITTYLNGISTKNAQEAHRQLDGLIQKRLGTYLRRDILSTLTTTNVGTISPKSPEEGNHIDMFGLSMAEAMPHLHLLQGRFPQSNTQDLEIMLTPATAQIWRVHIGSTITLSLPFSDSMVPPQPDPNAPPQYIIQGAPSTAHVVGIFTVPNAELDYWNQRDFDPVTAQGRPPITTYTFLCPYSRLLNVYDSIAAQRHLDAAFNYEAQEYNWRYALDPSKVSITKLDDLTAQIIGLQDDFTRVFGDRQGNSFSALWTPLPFPYINKIILLGEVLHPQVGQSTLEQFRDRVAVARIPMAVISIQIIALILFFVSMMVDLLIEQQTDAIALLRSRGASRSQIFGALFTQGLWLSLCALIVGILLSLLTVSPLLHSTLNDTPQNVFVLLGNTPEQAALNISWYAIVVILVAVTTMAITLRRAVSFNVLEMRRETARETRKPLWRRLHLDIIAAIIAATGYGLSVYLTSLGGQLDARSQSLISAPITLIAPLFLVIGSLFLFLRIFPLLLRWGTHLAGQAREASALLAIAHIARAPRQGIRMIMLLTFALSFTIFTQVFIASQTQRTQDIASYEVGADFRGPITYNSADIPALAHIEAQYRSIPGVLSVSAGFIGEGITAGTTPSQFMQVRAVDTTTFSRTAIWPRQASAQPLDTIMRELITRRDEGIKRNRVPVFVDTLAWNKLNLHLGSTFTIAMSPSPNMYYTDLNCLVVGKAEHIPTINDSTNGDINNDTPTPGAVLLDYQTYAAIYAQNSKQLSNSVDYTLPINYFWLHTKDDPAVQTHVRAKLLSTGIRASDLYDRHDLLKTMQQDPLSLELIGVLTLGTFVVLLFAILGDLLASFLNARTRLTNFAMLRALGTTPRQIASVLTWEHIILYSTALILGIVLGGVLAVTLVPNLLFSSVPTSGNLSNLTSGEFYALQHVLPPQINIPYSLGITFVVLLVICCTALGMMVRIVSRPSMSQVLRLNAD